MRTGFDTLVTTPLDMSLNTTPCVSCGRPSATTSTRSSRARASRSAAALRAWVREALSQLEFRRRSVSFLLGTDELIDPSAVRVVDLDADGDLDLCLTATDDQGGPIVGDITVST